MGWMTWIDHRAEPYRAQVRRGVVRDLGHGTMRPALHLTDLEHAYLQRNNPELGQEDSRLRSAAWLKFITSHDSDPYKVQAHI